MDVQPSTREAALLQVVLNLGTESWRILRTLERFASGLDADQRRRIAGRVAFFERTLRSDLEGVGLRLVEFTGQPYGPQLPATAVNGDEVAVGDIPVVEQTLEPAILGPDGILRTGKVTLRRGDS